MATKGALASEFFAHVADPDGLSDVPLASLEATLIGLVARAQLAWREIPQAPELFVRHLAERFVPTDGTEVDLESLRAEDLYLALACAQGVPEAMGAFEEHYLRAVPKLLAQAGHPDEALADEVQQLLREKLLVGTGGQLPKIAEYSGRGALMNWLRMAAVRTALNLRVKERRNVSASDESIEEDVLAGDDPELQYIKARYLEDFRAAFRDAFAALSAEERNLLRLKLVDRLNIDAIGVIFGKHRATIARWLAQTRQGIADAVRENLRQRLEIEGSELESMLKLMRSRLDVTLRGYLKGSEHGGAP